MKIICARRCLSRARPQQEGEVPVGCVIVKDGEIIGRGRNRREELQRTSSHAEMEAIAQANEASDAPGGSTAARST